VVHDIWEKFLTIVKEEAGSRVVETWFKAVCLQSWDPLHKIVHLQAPNSFVKDWIKTHYLEMINTHLRRLFHVDALKIVFIDMRSSSVEQTPSTTPAQHVDMLMPATLDVPGTNHEISTSVHQKKPGYINSNYVFENFVVGPSNSLAYAAAQAVTKNLGKVYNPLFIYGESGLGKTHLLHAIGNQIRLFNTQSTVLYQTADRFVNEFINAIRFDKIHKFQTKYQHIDVLLIDDIQFISNKDQTQEAFFHIFNTLYEASKQIIFSSDAYPQDMQGVAERLRSRLACGLIADIQVPSLETKIAILKKKAETSNALLNDEVILFIAAQGFANIRELEGALIRVLAFASLTQQTITMELAKKVLLRTADTQSVFHSLDFDRIARVVGYHFQYTVEDLKSKGRSRDLSFVRQVTMFMMKKMTDKSLRDIGMYLGRRDHSTVLHAIEKIEDHLVKHPQFEQEVKHIEGRVRGSGDGVMS
jgi:chromosomal replication initiator protein